MNNIILRTGCFCNTGACQTYLGLTDTDLLAMYEAGHVCGDMQDMLDDKPTGSVRISLGYMSDKSDIDRLIQLIRTNFLQTAAPPSLPPPLPDREDGPRVVGLYVYPVKSCAGTSVSSWTVTGAGLEYDRQWMVISGKTVLTQKREPLLSQIKAVLDLERRVLVLKFRNYIATSSELFLPVDINNLNVLIASCLVLL